MKKVQNSQENQEFVLMAAFHPTEQELSTNFSLVE